MNQFVLVLIVLLVLEAVWSRTRTWMTTRTKGQLKGTLLYLGPTGSSVSMAAGRRNVSLGFLARLG